MSARDAAALVAVAVLGGTLGFVAGRLSDGDSPTAAPREPSRPERVPPPSTRPRTRAVAPPTEIPSDAAAAAEAPPAGEGPETVVVPLPRPGADDRVRAQLEQRVGGEIPAVRVADVTGRSRQIREAALGAAASSDAAAVAQVAKEILAECAFAADASRGGTMQMLREIGKKRIRMFDLVGDRDAFTTHFVRSENGPTIEALKWKSGDGLPHGATLSFPAGTHVWSVRSFRSAGEFPRDLLVQGAGMDATLVRLDELDPDADVTNLTFRDCTIDCGDNYFTDLGGDHAITLRLERCRVIAFDMGAGGSVMLSAEAAAFFATDCRFEAGYGRTDPGYGNLFRVDSGLLARCEGCVFRGPFASVIQSGGEATQVFSNCRFERMEAGFEKVVAGAPAGVRFEGCTVVEPLEAKVRPEKRPLSDFNASWPSKTR